MPGHSYKGGTVRNAAAAPSFPVVLTALAGGNFSFTYAGTNPAKWGLFLGTTAIIANIVDNVTGTARSFSTGVDPNDQYVVAGVNSGLSAVTGPTSNVVTSLS